jgi:dihydroorotate dehydrogenase subfamily 2
VGFYTRIARPLLFKLPPETAQRLAEDLLQRRWLWGWASSVFQANDPKLRTSLAGIPLRNPIGLAAGYDKECRALSGLARLGFGYLVGGTVFPVPRAGNARPRLLRLPEQDALINALGFPSSGSIAAANNLLRVNSGGAAILVSIAALEVEDFVTVHKQLEPLVAGVELNISSPNTAGLAAFQEPSNLRDVLQGVMAQRTKPVFVKLPFGHDDASRQRVLDLVDVCLEQGADGVTAGNTLPLEEPRTATGRGGLSGRPILEDMLKTLAAIRSHAGDTFAINACGGIFTGQDAIRALQAGATTVQLFTGLVYQGPGVVKGICRELAPAFAPP